MTDTEMKGLRLLFRDLVLDIWNGCSVDGHGLKDGLMLVGRLIRTTQSPFCWDAWECCRGSCVCVLDDHGRVFR